MGVLITNTLYRPILYYYGIVDVFLSYLHILVYKIYLWLIPNAYHHIFIFTLGQMVMTSASNLTTLPQQQIVTQLVSGQTVQGTIGASTVGTTTITPGQV